MYKQRNLLVLALVFSLALGTTAEDLGARPALGTLTQPAGSDSDSGTLVSQLTLREPNGDPTSLDDPTSPASLTGLSPSVERSPGKLQRAVSFGGVSESDAESSVGHNEDAPISPAQVYMLSDPSEIDPNQIRFTESSWQPKRDSRDPLYTIASEVVNMLRTAFPAKSVNDILEMRNSSVEEIISAYLNNRTLVFGSSGFRVFSGTKNEIDSEWIVIPYKRRAREYVGLIRLSGLGDSDLIMLSTSSLFKRTKIQWNDDTIIGTVARMLHIYKSADPSQIPFLKSGETSIHHLLNGIYCVPWQRALLFYREQNGKPVQMCVFRCSGKNGPTEGCLDKLDDMQFQTAALRVAASTPSEERYRFELVGDCLMIYQGGRLVTDLMPNPTSGTEQLTEAELLARLMAANSGYEVRSSIYTGMDSKEGSACKVVTGFKSTAHITRDGSVRPLDVEASSRLERIAGLLTKALELHFENRGSIKTEG